MKNFASIDIGTNTVRLLILEIRDDGTFREIDSARRITRLGAGMDTAKKLLPEPIDATLKVLNEFRDICEKYQPLPIRAVATSAVREASNPDDFLAKALENTGLNIDVITWEEEARLTLEGVFWKFPPHKKNTLTFDIGGGSTEFILSKGKNISGFLSTSLGTVRLTEKYIHKHPVLEDEYRNLKTHIHSELTNVKKQLPGLKPEWLIGTAGTVTTLAALEGNIYPYNPEKIHGARLSYEKIFHIQNDLKKKSIEERLRLKPLERGREDLIIAGTAIVLETMDVFECELLTVSEYGLREGIILSAAPKSIIH